jgi:hypothetical protein
MEPALTSTQTATNSLKSGEEAGTPPEPNAADGRQRVIAYLQRLGIREPSLLETVAESCLQKARKRSGGAADQLVRLALEEAGRCLDHALTRAVHLSQAQDYGLLAGLRAALLLGRTGISSDSLFSLHDGDADVDAILSAALPQPTPAEAHLSMPEQDLQFWFWKSVNLRNP